MQRTLFVKGSHGRQITINPDHIESIEQPIDMDVENGIGARIRMISGHLIDVDHNYELLLKEVLP